MRAGDKTVHEFSPQSCGKDAQLHTKTQAWKNTKRTVKKTQAGESECLKKLEKLTFCSVQRDNTHNMQKSLLVAVRNAALTTQSTRQRTDK